MKNAERVAEIREWQQGCCESPDEAQCPKCFLLARLELAEAAVATGENRRRALADEDADIRDQAATDEMNAVAAYRKEQAEAGKVQP